MTYSVTQRSPRPIRPNGEVLVGKQSPRRPDGEPTTDALAGLGVLQHSVVVVDLILSIVVTGPRRGPVPVQRSSDVLISHLAFLSAPYNLGAVRLRHGDLASQ